MIWLSLFACGLEWTGERLPVSDFNVQHVLRLEGEELLVAGNASRNSPHDGKVFLRTAPDTYELVWQKRNALDVDDIVRTADTLWMITSEGRPGSSLSHVYCSEDEGRTWTHQSELPWGVRLFDGALRMNSCG